MTATNSRWSVLDAALSQSRTRRNTGKADAVGKQRARALLADSKRADARIALNERDALHETQHAARVTRMSALHDAIARTGVEVANMGDCDLRERLAYQIERMRVELSAIYGLPILASDIAPNGRFVKSLAYHGRKVGMTSHDYADILSQAVELAYRDADALTTVSESVPGGFRAGDVVPTIGGLYRAGRRAYRLQLAAFYATRSGKSQVFDIAGLSDLTDADVVKHEQRGVIFRDMSEVVENSHLLGKLAKSGIGHDYAPRYYATRTLSGEAVKDYAASVQAVHVWHALQRETRTDALSIAIPATVQAQGDDTLSVDMACASLLAQGETVETISEYLGITPKTLKARLSTLAVRHDSGALLAELAETSLMDEIADKSLDARTHMRYMRLMDGYAPKVVRVHRIGGSTGRRKVSHVRDGFTKYRETIATPADVSKVDTLIRARSQAADRAARRAEWARQALRAADAVETVTVPFTVHPTAYAPVPRAIGHKVESVGRVVTPEPFDARAYAHSMRTAVRA